MKNLRNILHIVSALFLVLMTSCNMKQKDEVSNQEPSIPKELYIPAEVYRVPEGNNYDDPNSDFSYDRMVEGDKIAIFWHKDYGKDPMANQDSTLRFNPSRMLIESERTYDVFVNDLALVQKDSSYTDKYKVLVYVIQAEQQTAFGGGAEDKIGIFWTPAVRVNKEPYGVLAHELGHSFQYLSRADTGTGPRGPIMEMSAQYMLWQVYQDWMTFENYHLVDYLKGTHYGFLHPTNMYHSPYVIEYWSEKHGKKFFGELMRSTQEGEDPIMTYKRLNNLSQEEFNDEMFDASRRFITWDLKRVDSVANQYANMHYTKVNKLKNGWYQIDTTNTPQNYGYNGIKLKVPEDGTKVDLDFKGIAGDDAFEKVQIDKAGWRYGFVAYLDNGKRVYSDIFKESNGKASFKVPSNTEYLWLVVSGAPTEHWPRPMRRRNSDEKTPDEEWPYQFKLTGTDVSEQ